MRRFVFSGVAVGFVGVVALSAFYRWFDAAAERMTEKAALQASMANGIKHAYAAGEMYALMRAVGFGAATSETIVMGLGELNEYAERLMKRPPDTTEEVAKDLHNNYVGIVAAQWFELQESAHGTRGEVIVKLAKARVIADSPAALAVESAHPASEPTRGPDVARATAWFEDNSAVIARKVDSALTTLSSHLDADAPPVL